MVEKFIENVPRHLIKLNSVYRPLSTDNNSAMVNSTDSESIMTLIYINLFVCAEKNDNDCRWLVNKTVFLITSGARSELAQEHLVWLNPLILVWVRVSKWTWFIGRSRLFMLLLVNLKCSTSNFGFIVIKLKDSLTYQFTYIPGASGGA